MAKIKIPKSEFADRVRRIQETMKEQKLDACFIYGDEYRKENLRYVSNYWPIFERGAALIPLKGDPVVIGAPECEKVAREMSVWPEYHSIKEFTCVTVSGEIEYPSAQFTSLGKIFKELPHGPVKRLGITGLESLGYTVYRAMEKELPGVEFVDANKILADMRIIKSENEIACLRESWRICDVGIEALMKVAVPGNTELYVTGVAEAAARAEGAEHFVFMVFGSGPRGATVVGRPADKVIKEGEMVMASFGVQYEGYVSTVEFPLAAGKPSSEQKDLMDLMIRTNDEALKKIGPGVRAGEIIKFIKDKIRAKGLIQYDCPYPPFHGCGLAEAELPYPDQNSPVQFQPGMTINIDVSLFGHPAGSNRIEEGFAVTMSGTEPFSKLVRKLSEQWLKGA
jgi:Xaa-Pro aminopeptidase